MHRYPQNLDTLFNAGGLEHQSPETNFNFNMMSPLQTSKLYSWTSFHQHDPPIGVPTSFCSDDLLEKIDSPLPCHKSSGDNSIVSSVQDPSASQFIFTNSLHSIVESFLSRSSEESFSSSDMHTGLRSDSDKMSLYGQSQENELREDVKPLEISFQRNPQSDEQCSRACRVAGVPFSRSSLTRKRRIRWTKDLHEPFAMIVNCLGGPHKAKPKSILQMMDSDVLTISHIKSHLQKYRSTTCVGKDLPERSGNGKQSEGVSELQVKIHKQIEESLQLQREVQRSLHEQEEIQRNLQQLIKHHRKQIKIMSDHQKQGSRLQECIPK